MSTPRVSDEAKVWACLTANALMLPGLGSMMAGQWLSGLIQAALSAVGFAMTAFWAFKWIAQVLAEHALPEDGFGAYFTLGWGGLLLFGIAWGWAVAASALQLRALGRARSARETTRDPRDPL